MAAYIDGLSRYTVEAVEHAARNWPDQPNGEWWPTLAELGRLAARFDAPASLPRPDLDDAQRTRPRDTRTLRTSASLRAEYVELMAELRENPQRFAGATALIALGEAIMARAGMSDASARAA